MPGVDEMTNSRASLSLSSFRSAYFMWEPLFLTVALVGVLFCAIEGVYHVQRQQQQQLLDAELDTIATTAAMLPDSPYSCPERWRIASAYALTLSNFPRNQLSAAIAAHGLQHYCYATEMAVVCIAGRMIGDQCH